MGQKANCPSGLSEKTYYPVGPFLYYCLMIGQPFWLGPIFFYEQENFMKENISSPELTLNIWSNDACRGYVIMAMQDCGFTHKDISRVVNQLYGVFDLYTLNEAEQKYYNGDY